VNGSGATTENGEVRLFTIGFTRRSAEGFFTALCDAGVRRVIDVRLNNTSQLAGFSKRDDLVYFLKNLSGIEYSHLPQLAPTQEMLDAYKKQKGDWATYAKAFLALMAEREIEKSVPARLLDGGCLLCSEDKPHHCHRRLVAEYLSERFGHVRVRHL
jgi:uncharacterized protein (DUF488 family)